MRINVILSLLKKEFLNIVRDRKSFIIMILLPLLMFPLMIGLISIILTTFTKVNDTIKFGVNYEINSDFKEFVDNYSDKYKIKIIYDNEEKLKEMFDDDKLGIYIIKNNNTYELHYDENKTTEVATSSIIENLYKDYREKFITDRLAQRGISYDEIKNLYKIEFVQESVTEMGSLIPSVISMVLVMIISSVCFSVSIDVTTSEKEKGTLETLLSLPIRKTELITSKYITVFLLSVLSGFLTYVSLFCTLYFAGNILSTLGVISIKIDFSVLIIYFISIILISLLFSGLLLSVTIFSKNLKEAQNSLYPLEIFVTIVSMLPMFGIKASMKFAIVPFINISLLFNNVLSSTINPFFVILTFSSSIIYSILLIIIISKLYNQEDILFNSKALSYISFKNGKSKTICFNSFTALLIAIIILLLDVYFSLLFITSSKYILLAMMPITTFIVITIASILVNLDIKESFKLNKFKFRSFIILFLLYIGTYILGNFIIEFTANIFPSIVKNFNIYSELLITDNLMLSILVMAVLPAIFEELLFRGILFTSFNKKYGFMIAAFVSALLFGVYHMNWIQGIYAFIFGLAFAYSYYKSNSIFVSIIFHFINNLIATLSSYFDVFNFTISAFNTVILIIIGLFLIIFSIYMMETQKN